MANALFQLLTSMEEDLEKLKKNIEPELLRWPDNALKNTNKNGEREKEKYRKK